MKQELFEYNSVSYIIEIGENKYDNFDIIDNAIDTDIWFHVESIPSSHVLLKTTEKMSSIPRQALKQCAYLCKINSKAKTMKKCVVSYTTMNNVKKTNIIGQVSTANLKTICV